MIKAGKQSEEADRSSVSSRVLSGQRGVFKIPVLSSRSVMARFRMDLIDKASVKDLILLQFLPDVS